MQPSTRIAFTYPIYALDLLPDGTIAIAGGGGLMKSGIPNRCALISFDPQSLSLSETASIDLPDAVVALAASGTTLHSIIGVGVKNFSCSHNTLTTQSSFRHDLRVSATQDQSAIAVSADLSTLIVASDEGHVVSLSLPRYEKLFSAQLHTQGITDLAISHDSTLVATTSRDRSAYIWRSRTGQIDQILKPVMPPDIRTHIRAIRFCQSNPDIIFTIESNPRKGGWIAVWQRPRHTHETAFKPKASLKASADAITTFSVNTDGSLISASSSEGHVMLLRWGGSSFSLVWSTETKSNWFSPPRPPHDLPITGLRFSKSGDFFFSASADYTVAAWPVKSPTDRWRVQRFAFWLLNILILIFAMLVVDDHALPTAIRYHRSTLQPCLEPHLSKIQGYVRPFIRDRQAQIRPYLDEIQSALRSREKPPEKLMRPHLEKRREHHTLWKSKLLGTCERISWEYDLFSSSVSYATEETNQPLENFDEADRKTEPSLQASKEETSIDSTSHKPKQRTSEKPSRVLEEPSLNIDNTHRIHDHSDKRLHYPLQSSCILESHPSLDISPHGTTWVKKLIQGQRTAANGLDVRSIAATDTISHYANLHSERRRGFAMSSSDPSIERHDRLPPAQASTSYFSEAEGSNTKRPKVTQLQIPESGSERDSIRVTSEKPLKKYGPLSSQALSKGSKPLMDLSALNLKSSQHDSSSKRRNQMMSFLSTGAESTGNKKNNNKCVTRANRNCVTIAKIKKDLVLAGAKLSKQPNEAMSGSEDMMDRNTFGRDHKLLEPPETSSHPTREGSEKTTSELFVAQENVLEEVYAGIDSVLAESSQVFGKYTPRQDGT